MKASVKEESIASFENVQSSQDRLDDSRLMPIVLKVPTETKSGVDDSSLLLIDSPDENMYRWSCLHI